MKKPFFLLCMLLMSVSLLTAQNVVKGTVIDQQGNPLSGAIVEVIGAAESIVIQADSDGIFETQTMFVPKKVKVSCYGMKTKVQLVEPYMAIRLKKVDYWSQYPDRSVWVVSPQVIFPEMGTSNPSFGLMVARVRVSGIYVKCFYSPSQSTEGIYQDLDGVHPWTTGKDKRSYMAAVAGGLYRLANPLYAYIGIGYVNRKVAWQLIDGTYVRNTKYSYEGGVLDYGLLLHYKHFTINGGAMMGISDGCKIAANVGIGYSF